MMQTIIGDLTDRDSLSDWPLALYRHAIPFSLIRPIVPDRHVLRAAIVPHRHVVRAPLKARLVPRTLCVLKEELENRFALVFRQTFDLGREGPVDEQRLLSRVAMRPDDRMRRARIHLARVVHAALRVTPAIDVLRL